MTLLGLIPSEALTFAVVVGIIIGVSKALAAPPPRLHLSVAHAFAAVAGVAAEDPCSSGTRRSSMCACRAMPSPS